MANIDSELKDIGKKRGLEIWRINVIFPLSR